MNRRELCDGLDVADVERLSDAHLVLAAYARWDIKAVTRLLGDFAFALWDPRTRHLHLVRDALGMRGLSFTEGPDFIAFATEPRQLLRLDGVDRRPNVGFFAEWVAGRMSHPSQTIFANIERVQPAHILTFTPEGRRTSRYWDIDPQREIRYGADREYVEHFRHLFRDAVRARLRGLEQVGVFLSGGLDSSSLVAMTARMNAGNRPVAVRAYSLTCDGLEDGDDEQSASAVAQFCGVPLAVCRFGIRRRTSTSKSRRRSRIRSPALSATAATPLLDRQQQRAAAWSSMAPAAMNGSAALTNTSLTC